MGVSARKTSTRPDPILVARLDLQAELEEAETAAAEIAELDAKRARAESVDLLKAQAKNEQEQAEAEAALEAARANVRQRLTALKASATAWRERFSQWVAEGGDLARDLADLQKRRGEARSYLGQAVQVVYEANNPWHPPTAEEAVKAIPLELQDPGDLVGEWDRLGGRDPALALLPSGVPPASMAHALAELVRKRAVVLNSRKQ